jgi:hypothetical protein
MNPTDRPTKKVLVKLRMEIDYPVSVPAEWTPQEIEFYLNDSCHCADNELRDIQKSLGKDGCLCEYSQFQYLRDV